MFPRQLLSCCHDGVNIHDLDNTIQETKLTTAQFKLVGEHIIKTVDVDNSILGKSSL